MDMRMILSASLKIALLNFLVSIVFSITNYLLYKNSIKINGISLCFMTSSVILFIVSVGRFGKQYINHIFSLIILTSLSVIFLQTLMAFFSLFLHEYIDTNLRFEIAQSITTQVYANILEIEKTRNIEIIFDYEEEVAKRVNDFEPLSMVRSNLILALISLVVYNFLVLLFIRSRSNYAD